MMISLEFKCIKSIGVYHFWVDPLVGSSGSIDPSDQMSSSSLAIIRWMHRRLMIHHRWRGTDSSSSVLQSLPRVALESNDRSLSPSPPLSLCSSLCIWPLLDAPNQSVRHDVQIDAIRRTSSVWKEESNSDANVVQFDSLWLFQRNFFERIYREFDSKILIIPKMF